MKMSWLLYKEKMSDHIRAVLAIKTSPFEIALGFAVGTFFAMFPTFGLEFVMIFVLLATFKRISKIAVGLAYVVFNPLVTYPLSALGYVLGNALLGSAPVVIVELTLFEQAMRFTLRYLLGNFIIALSLAMLSFVVVFVLTKKYQSL